MSKDDFEDCPLCGKPSPKEGDGHHCAPCGADFKRETTKTVVSTVRCEACNREMYPLLYADGSCCGTPSNPVGQRNYKCASCGKSADVEHRHTL